MFNTMNTIRPKPYPQRGNGNYNAGNDGADKDGHNQNGREYQNQRQTVARGRAEELQQAPVEQRQPIYSPAANAYSQSRYPNQTSPQMRNGYNIPVNQVNPQQYQMLQSSYQPIQQQSAPQPMQQQVPMPRSNKVNIAQILKDFRNTIKAIATPADIEEQVNKYLQIVEEMVHDSRPQVNLIQSNLKIAASLLDKYISETLNKESKVVQNWLDALFLQRINYSYDEQEINPSFLVQFPDENERKTKSQETENKPEAVNDKTAPVDAAETEEENVYSELEEYNPQTLEEEFTEAQKVISQKPNITIIPQDTRLKALFMEAKRHAFSNNPQKAMSVFKEAFTRAEQINDTETQSRICLEIGKIYDDNDFMAQIYDDVNQVEHALNHYITSISYAGKSDDLIGQSDSLTKVGNIFTDKYDSEAFEYYDTARKLVEQTTDNNMKGYVLSNTADACVHFRKDDKALKYYAEAVKNYEKSNSTEEIAENYKSAAELMIRFNSPNKAKSLLKKAMVNAVKTKNEDLISEINLLLTSLSN